MLRFVLFLLAAVFVLIFTAANLAHAQGLAAEGPAGVAFMNWLVYLLTIVALAAVSWAAVRGAKWAKAKTGLDIEVLLRSIGETGVSMMEEKAYRYAKDVGSKLSSNQKREGAMDFARDQLKEYGLDAKLEKKLGTYVDGALGTTRTPAAP